MTHLAERILEELQHAGPHGVTPNRLHELGGLSATRRISELRQAGYHVDRDVESGIYRLEQMPTETTWPIFRCKRCEYEAAEPQFIHTVMFGAVCPTCGGKATLR